MEDFLKELQEDEIEDKTSITVGDPTQGTIAGLRMILLKQEDTRAFLARSLIFIFAGSVLFAFGYIYLSTFYPTALTCGMIADKTICISDNNGKDMITLVLSSLTAVIGTALGFYFGSRS